MRRFFSNKKFVVVGVFLGAILVVAILAFLGQTSRESFIFEQGALPRTGARQQLSAGGMLQVGENFEAIRPLRPGSREDGLTANFFQKILDLIVAENPDGPQPYGDIEDALVIKDLTPAVYLTINDYRLHMLEKSAPYVKEIKVSEASDPASQLQYINKLFAISDQYFRNQYVSSDIAIARYFFKKDSKSLASITGSYQNTLKESLALTVPRPLEDLHASYVSNLIYITAILEDVAKFRDMQADPVAALSIYQFHQSLLRQQAEVFKALMTRAEELTRTSAR